MSPMLAGFCSLGRTHVIVELLNKRDRHIVSSQIKKKSKSLLQASTREIAANSVVRARETKISFSLTLIFVVFFD